MYPLEGQESKRHTLEDREATNDAKDWAGGQETVAKCTSRRFLEGNTDTEGVVSATNQPENRDDLCPIRRQLLWANIWSSPVIPKLCAAAKYCKSFNLRKCALLCRLIHHINC
ncbi:unnamed protein product [Protopolystoma xenopodis]|uniref:Uncharacterized protein n=1 Tax=Protopolystoma xenopodis TaxID=117903 RepID=A0A448XA63_9PLAT|nr:unnamed protein product [Protopolystoma xenopodis]